MNENIKFLILVAGCRAGAELFHSLLDNHQQIIQFPGTIFFNKKFIKSLKRNYEKIAVNFIDTYPHFFDSRLKTVERHHMLGENKDEVYFVDKIRFKENFLNLDKKNKKKSIQNVIIDLHCAYQKTINNQFNLKDVKYILINTHTLVNTKNFHQISTDFEYEIIHSIRHPISAINSATKNWINYKRGVHFNAKDIFFQINLITQAINFLKKLNRKLFVIQLENMHQNSENFINDFCNIFNIKKSKNLFKSTFHGKKWWGDAVSNRFLTGLNKNFVIQTDNYDFVTNDDCIFFYEIMKIFFINYGYETKFVNRRIIKWKPLKCEILTWKNSFKNRKFQHLLSIPYFYLMRILFINRFFCKYKDLPYSIGNLK